MVMNFAILTVVGDAEIYPQDKTVQSEHINAYRA